MKPEQTEKKCENCRYFCQHYVQMDTFYTTVYCGHCLKNYTNNTFKKCRANDTACELWESIVIKKTKQQESIKSALKNMAAKINEIALILKDDKSDGSHNL